MTFFLDFRQKFIEKLLEEEKKVENVWKKYFDQLSGARCTQNLVEIHNKLLKGSSKKNLSLSLFIYF